MSEAGRRTREAQTQAKIADELYPVIETILDELDRWLSVSAPPARPQPAAVQVIGAAAAGCPPAGCGSA